MAKNKISRRQFLKKSGQGLLGGGALSHASILFLDTIANGLVNKAMAESNGIVPRKWVDMVFDLAPPRWVYDLVLQTSSADAANFSQGGNLQLITRYEEVAGRYQGGIYTTTPIGSVRAPFMWQFSVPRAGGGERPLSELFNNLLNIRGIYTGNSGHNGNRISHYAPAGAPTSIQALSADYSHSPIPSVFYPLPDFTFRSQKGRSPQTLSGDANLLNNLLKPFTPGTSVSTVRQNETQVTQYLTNLRNALSQSAVARHPDSAIAVQSLANARELIFFGFGNLAQIWATLTSKYQGLIRAALQATYPGINDKPVGITGTRDGTYRVGSRNLRSPDLRSLFNSSVTISNMAESFAVTEFILLNDLSDSITVPIGTFTGLSDGEVPIRHNFDEHALGAVPSLLINTLHSVAHSACLLELIDRLRQAGMWNNTIINCSGEMNRSPLMSGLGSDHSTTVNLALYSGCIQAPMILGNLAVTHSAAYPGTWGTAAPQDELGGKITPAHALNTVAALLRVPNVVPGRPSLVNVSSNEVTASIPTGRIIV